MLLAGEFESLAERVPTFGFDPVVGHPVEGHWGGYAGYVTQSIIAAEVQDLRAPHYYLCGPPVMVATIIEALDAHDVPHEHIHREQW
ncbi:MAG: hypothetical protein HC945_01790 [Nitrosarchaeum sp.]|nr:hypothetical protein [Nitrosarchaeum sp.]